MIFKASTTTIIIIFSFQVLFDEFICTRWAPYIMPILQLYTFFFYYKYNILTIKVISARQGHGWVVGRQVFHVETERFLESNLVLIFYSIVNSSHQTCQITITFYAWFASYCTISRLSQSAQGKGRGLSRGFQQNTTLYNSTSTISNKTMYDFE